MDDCLETCAGLAGCAGVDFIPPGYDDPDNEPCVSVASGTIREGSEVTTQWCIDNCAEGNCPESLCSAGCFAEARTGRCYFRRSTSCGRSCGATRDIESGRIRQRSCYTLVSTDNSGCSSHTVVTTAQVPPAPPPLCSIFLLARAR